MLPLMLSLALSAQALPVADACAAAPSQPFAAGTAVIEGTLELSRAEAEASAIRAARHNHRERLLSAGEEVVRRVLPDWLPGFFVRHELDEWTRRLAKAVPLQIVQTETSVRRYSYGEAFQTTLRCNADVEGAARAEEPWLQRRLRVAGRLMLASCGGVAVYWGLLAFLFSWFDRLTRGYMSWRLRIIALGLGLSVPSVLLML